MHPTERTINSMNEIVPKDKARRERILDAATSLISHFGYNKTTVADIAAKAGISKGAVYLHFKSKDEVLEALLIEAMYKFSTSWFDAIENDPQGGLISRMYLNMLQVHIMLVVLQNSTFRNAPRLIPDGFFVDLFDSCLT